MTAYIDLLKGMADETRLRVLGLLEAAGGELCVCQITGALGESQYKISRHLKVLKNSGWLRERRNGRWIHYRLADPVTGADLFPGRLREVLQTLSAEFLRLQVRISELETLRKAGSCKE